MVGVATPDSSSFKDKLEDGVALSGLVFKKIDISGKRIPKRLAQCKQPGEARFSKTKIIC